MDTAGKGHYHPRMHSCCPNGAQNRSVISARSPSPEVVVESINRSFCPEVAVHTSPGWNPGSACPHKSPTPSKKRAGAVREPPLLAMAASSRHHCGCRSFPVSSKDPAARHQLNIIGGTDIDPFPSNTSTHHKLRSKVDGRISTSPLFTASSV